MSMPSWLRNVFARPTTRPIGKAPPRARPALEALEDRTVPSTFTVTNTLDDGSAGSLRWAVGQANAAGGANTINFDPTVFASSQTIILSRQGGELKEGQRTPIADSIEGMHVGAHLAEQLVRLAPGGHQRKSDDLLVELPGLLLIPGHVSGVMQP